MWSRTALDQFAINDYERRPTVLRRQALSTPLFTAADACEVLSELIRQGAATWSANGFKADSLALPVRVRSSGVLEDMGSFIDEVCALNGVDEFTVSAHNCHTLVPRLQIKLLAFLTPLFKLAGVPSNGVNLMVFGGRYRVTPAGLHNDPCDIFLCPVLGGKKLLVWPWQYFDDNADELTPIAVEAKRLPETQWTEHVSRALTLDPAQGEVAYFPAGHWHVNDYGMPERSFSFGISIFKNLNAGKAAASMTSRLASTAQAQATLPTLSAQTATTPLVSVVDELDELMRLNTLQRATSGGFVTGLTKAQGGIASLGRAGLHRLVDGAPLFCVKCRDGRYAVVANGKVAKLALPPAALDMLRSLASGAAVDLGSRSTHPATIELATFLNAQGILTFQGEAEEPCDTCERT